MAIVASVIVWVASFPRSGNTFLRILLHQRYGVTTSTVYDVDGVAARLGPGLVGYRRHTADYQVLRASDAVHFIKTHRPRDELVDGADKTICLVRDGRDAVVSWARQRAESPGRTFESELQELVMYPERRGAGCWGTNVLSWLEAGDGRVLVRFEDLIAEPAAAVDVAVRGLGIGLSSPQGSACPSFEELQAIDPRFFRVGKVGTHRNEMPPKMQQAFLVGGDNRAALSALGYLD